ncbi:Uncharacterized protein GBIM_13886 [Gryllus bimaculatus]|nr:Uncharacterized protein GBIM_13886 [Gryllus bimaculatus]
MATSTQLLRLALCAAVLLACGRGAPAQELDRENEVEDGVGGGGSSQSMRMVYKLVVDCLQKEDMGVCLKLKALGFLERALALRAPLPIMEFVTLARDPNAPEDAAPAGPPPTEAELEATLPRALDEKSSRLDQLLMDKVEQLLRTRSLQLALPKDAFEVHSSSRILASNQVF